MKTALYRLTDKMFDEFQSYLNHNYSHVQAAWHVLKYAIAKNDVKGTHNEDIKILAQMYLEG